ncbi:hypothetical protein JCM11641_004524 [Rhodosporidiobolus odoratus]
MSIPALDSLSSLRDQFDSLLEDYLTCLCDYQTARASLNTALKDGYFHLAKAKLALGPSRLSQNSYNLAGKPADTIVSICPVSTPSKPSPEDSATSPLIPPTNLSYSILKRDPPTPPSPNSTAEPTPSQLRHRPAPTSPPASSTSTRSLPEPASPARRHAAPSPLHQFSAFPPPSLRSSASSFGRALGAAALVVEAEGKVREAARQVKRKRREVERAEKTEGKGGEQG